MSAWASDELNAIGTATELKLAPLRADGRLRRPVTIWVVRDGDDLYVRSYTGSGAAWFRGALTRHEGRIWAGGVEKEVTLVEERDPGRNTRIDDAYRAKYRRVGGGYVEVMVAPQARATTLRLVPRDETTVW